MSWSDNSHVDDGQRICIVVVEDEPDVAELLYIVLKDEGYHVVSFNRAHPATSLQGSVEYPNLFLLDIMLPDMDGITLATRLTDEGFASTPKIAMSASRGMLHMAEASHLFHETLSKPFDLDRLLSCVERCVAA